jgi:sulfatase maturation enzyme AslB (radical SAM superfamily)
MEERVLLPPRYNHYKRDEWNLLYDPVNVIWIRVNQDGMKILDALKREGTIAGVLRYFADESPEVPAEKIKGVIDSYIQNLAQVGFLHVGEYREKRRELFYMEAPENIFIMMTYKCNSRCLYCYNMEDRQRFNKIKKKQKEPEMSMEEYRQLVEDAKEIGVKRFLFTGGEPLLNPLTLQVGKYSKELGLKTELISNGLLIDESNVEDIVETFDYISVSLDSMNKVIHDRMRGKGSYDPFPLILSTRI